MNGLALKSRTILLLAVAGVAGMMQSAAGQVLEVSSKKANLVQIEMKGPVVETKKYSFVVKHQEKDFRVKLVPGTSMTLRLNRPYFDFTANEVAVLPSGVSPNDQVVPTRYKLPKPMYVSAEFAHVAQMKRIMSSESLRLNQYRLSAGPLPQVLPDEKNLRFQSLVELDENDKPFVTINGKKRPIILGFRGATLAGQTIIQIKAGSTKAFIWGEIDRNADEHVVTPSRIEFVPMLTK